MDSKTVEIIDLFGQINQIPRCSKQEAAISEWVCHWARERNLKYDQDTLGNIVIRVPASPGKERAPAVVLQGHMDMVCEKRPEVAHDFSRDPIPLEVDGEWLKANGTTLGADNGIALAIALAFAQDTEVVHPAMELLFTVDEETGLNGAKSLGPDFIIGRRLLNIDSEDEGVFTIGCAGGKNAQINKVFPAAIGFSGGKGIRLTAGGMRGGHSGVDIHKTRANAIRIMARWLDLIWKETPFKIAEMGGGKALNAIPRQAGATIVIDAARSSVPEAVMEGFQKDLENEYGDLEPAIRLSAEEAPENQAEGKLLGSIETRQAIDLLLALPHGVAAMSKDMEGVVETSSNLATVRLEESALGIGMSQRSSVSSRLSAINLQIEAVARIAGAEVTIGNGYPSWKPDLSSPLLRQCRNAYFRRFGIEPKIEAVHAGLECGVIGSIYPGMDMISFGPTLKNPHSPDETLYIPSIRRLWDFMGVLLADLAEG